MNAIAASHDVAGARETALLGAGGRARDPPGIAAMRRFFASKWGSCTKDDEIVLSAGCSSTLRAIVYDRIGGALLTAARSLMTFVQASEAIYVDFECLQAKPPRPALLGVLTDTEPFEQIIVDERLASAKVANARLRVLSPEVAANELVKRAIAENRQIVGWSYFDRGCLKDAAPALESEIDAGYMNALHLARPWRRALHPRFVIEREDRFTPKHTLDKYAFLAVYPDSGKLVGATPAKWIRHTAAQLQATGGRYRATTRQPKRDWHRLLDYNHHDCLALRHIVLKAAQELECWHAYERTRFCVDDGGRRVCFMAGSRSSKLDALLSRHGASRWAFVTAYNPASVSLSRAANDARQNQLEELLRKRGFEILHGEGIGEDASWEPERSVLVLGISRKDAVKVGRQFGQLAILAGQRAGKARLLSCALTPPVNRRRQPRPR